MQKFKVDPKLVSRIEEKTKLKLKELNLTDFDDIKNSITQKKHTYKSKCLGFDGKYYFFKTRLHDEELLIRTFKNEFDNTLFFYNTKYFKTHKPLEWSFDKDFSWVLYEYFDGKLLLDESSNNDIFNKLYQVIFRLQSIPENIISDNIKNFYTDFLKIFGAKITNQDSQSEIILKQTKMYLENINLKLPEEKILNLINKNKNLLNKAPKKIAHGDLMMDNILLDNNDYYLIDFEYSQLNYSVHDLVSLYNWAWDKPKWQEKLLSFFQNKLMENKDDFKNLFIITLLLHSLYHLCYYNDNKPSLFTIPKKVCDFKVDTIEKLLKGYGAVAKG
jgi:hypothetical protein